MRGWWVEKDYLDRIAEKRIPASMSQQETVDMIVQDLSRITCPLKEPSSLS